MAHGVSGGTLSSGAMKKFPASISTPTELGLSLNPGSQESVQPTSRPSRYPVLGPRLHSVRSVVNLKVL